MVKVSVNRFVSSRVKTMRNEVRRRLKPTAVETGEFRNTHARQCAEHFFEHIPAGVVQVKCNYCEASVLVPPHLGREARQCPNHPDALAVGICNDWAEASVIVVCTFSKSGMKRYFSAQTATRAGRVQAYSVTESLAPCQ